MSYSFKVIKKDGKIELVQPTPAEMQHIPDGEFYVNGHHEDGQYGIFVGDDIGVRLTRPDGTYLYGYGSVRTPKEA